jgi:hypothetical protein
MTTTQINEPTSSIPLPGSPASARRSKAWIYYALLSVLSLASVASGAAAGLIAAPLLALYSVYLYRGGRFVVWIW